MKRILRAMALLLMTAWLAFSAAIQQNRVKEKCEKEWNQINGRSVKNDKEKIGHSFSLLTNYLFIHQ